MYNKFDKKISPVKALKCFDGAISVENPESVLCADSVGKFMEAHGVDMAHPERKSRCAGVAAGIAGKITEMLNERLV